MLKKPDRAVVPGKAKRPGAKPRPALTLQRGQIWKAGDTYIQIREAGARLIHYTMAKALHQPGLRRHLSSIQTVEAFLTARQAELLPDSKPQPTAP